MGATPFILLTGASGLLGRQLLKILPPDWCTVALTHTRELSSVRPGFQQCAIDLTADPNQMQGILETFFAHLGAWPTAIVHAAAVTDVDACEVERRGEAERLHRDATRVLAALAKRAGAHCIFISTDQVFDGARGGYLEDDEPRPVNVYGKTKRDGELALMGSGADWTVIRTNFFGHRESGRIDFSEWILGALRDSREIPLFDDVLFSPLFVGTLSRIIVRVIAERVTSILHLAARDVVSKYEFGQLLSEAFGFSATPIVRSSVEMAQLLAQRPKNMSLAGEETARRLSIVFPTVKEEVFAYRQALIDK